MLGKQIAFITGITGQDGSYLAELLLSNGYEVHGMVRRISQPNFSNISSIKEKLHLHTGDMTDSTSIFRIIKEVRPTEIYNLAAMSQVLDSYYNPITTQDINCNGLIRIMEAVRTLETDSKIYQACSSEMFGGVQSQAQNEETYLYPMSPYGASKAAAFHQARLWRKSYGLKIYCGILFNHESPRRGPAFLTRKVCMGVAEIIKGKSKSIKLGNLDSVRDWGYAKECMEWVYRIMQGEPDDFVIATGEGHTVKEWVKESFSCAGISDWEKYIEFDNSLIRPSEVIFLTGNFDKSKRILGFEPRVKFKELVRIMMYAECQ